MARWLLAFALSGCGGAIPPSAVVDPNGCPQDRVRLGEACWSAEGTEWRVHAEGPAGVYAFEIALLAGGRVRSTDHPQASPATDEWFQDGAVLRVLLADRFVEYRATIGNGTVLFGEARSVRGPRWTFRAERMFVEPRCQPNEATLEGHCFDAAGTRWRLQSPTGEVMVALLAGGRVAIGAEEPAAGDRWEQQGEVLRLTIERGAAQLVAQLRSADELRGSGSDRSGARYEWSATRLPSLAPPYRR